MKHWDYAALIKAYRPQRGILFRLGSPWIGAHYSAKNRRWCINPIPCVTFWFTLAGGNPP